MTEEKRNRIIAAVTVTVILLIVILAAIVIYQLAILASMSKQKRQIEEDISYYQEQTAKDEQTLEDLQAEWYLRQKLFEYGYRESTK